MRFLHSLAPDWHILVAKARQWRASLVYYCVKHQTSQVMYGTDLDYPLQ